MSEELKQVVDELIEKRNDEEEEEQEYIKPDVPKEFWLDTTEIERLKIQNFGLQRTILNQQQKEIETQINNLFNEMKTRAGVDLSAQISMHPQDLTKVKVSFERVKNGT
jgi:hypothetical protein